MRFLLEYLNNNILDNNKIEMSQFQIYKKLTRQTTAIN